MMLESVELLYPSVLAHFLSRNRVHFRENFYGSNRYDATRLCGEFA